MFVSHVRGVQHAWQWSRASCQDGRSSTGYLVERTAMNLVGRWRILEMDLSDREAIDLVGPGFLEFRQDGTGSFGFIAVAGWMDCRPMQTASRPGVDFTWDGTDEGDHVSGRGVDQSSARVRSTDQTSHRSRCSLAIRRVKAPRRDLPRVPPRRGTETPGCRESPRQNRPPDTNVSS